MLKLEMQSNDVKERQTIVSDQYFSLVANVDINKVVIGQNFFLISMQNYTEQALSLTVIVKAQ